MLSEIMPCPFCGAAPRIEEREPEWAIVTCPNCLADGPYYPEPDSTTPEDAVHLWNGRK